jgi:hypothetical protein
VATLLVIPILIACSCVEHSIGYASAAVTISPMAAEETKTAGNDDNVKSDVKNSDCKDNKDDNKNKDDDNKKQDACSESKSKDALTSKSSDDTSVTPHKDDDNKKHKDPFLLPFP